MNSYSPNNLNQYSQAGPNSVTNGSEHEIAAYAGIAYTYLADTFLSSVSGNGNSYQLVYDGLGRCVKRTLNGVTTYYQYDGDRPIYEYKTDGSTAGWNVYGKGIDEILLRADYVAVPGGQGYFFQQDSQGNVTHLTSFEGTTIESYRYDAFGAPTTTYSGGSFNNRFKFTGREYQSAFGIYEYRHRAYHPGLGRFMSEDPMGFAAGDANLYRYCGNNPGNRSDPFGLVEKKKERESDASGVIVDGHYDFGPNDNGFTELTDRNGGLGFLNQGGGGGGFDWFGGTAFTFANNAAPTSSLWPPPTLGVQPLPPSPDGSPQSTSFYAGIEAGLQWLRDNANLTVDFAQTFGVVPIPAGNAAILVPVGGHAFATIDKSGITLGAGSGIVAASGLVAMSGAPFGQTSGTQLVSQVFGSLGPAGGYYSGILSQSGAATEKGVAIGAGSGIAITLDGTVHFNWPGHH
jgi:RHS repeat-associated protein